MIAKYCIVGVAAAAIAAAAGAQEKDTSKMRIAFSNSFAGNSFRQVMVKSWQEGTEAAIAEKAIKSATVISANNSAPEQAAQIQNLILEGYNAIVVNAASPTALNGVVKQACDAGIVVVAFDGIVTEKCAYIVNYDWKHVGLAQVDYLASRLGNKGAVLEVRGIAGNSVDSDIHGGVAEGVKRHPAMKIVGSVHGNFTQTVAQREVAGILPTLPNVDAVATQGGDGYGTAQAFEAAKRKRPIIIMGNREDELRWWKQQHTTDGYETMSISATPGVSMIAFWVAQQVLAGQKVPKFVKVPFLQINQDQLDAWLAATPKGSVTNPIYSKKWVASLIAANSSGQALPPISLPAQR